MKPSVYMETSVINYLAAQVSRDLVVAAHQQITAEWWKRALPEFTVFVPTVVMEEIGRGDPQVAKRRAEAVSAFDVLEVTPEVRTLADRYFTPIDLPERARADAYHLALAAWHGMDYLVTWNCTHIASGKVKLIVQRVNASQSIASPVIVSQWV